MANPNLELLIAITNAMGPLREQVVFVGGCATGLLITQPLVADVRATDDVDAIRKSCGFTTCAPTSISRSRPTHCGANTWKNSSSSTTRRIGMNAKPRGALRIPDGRWRVYDYAELIARDKASLDIFWLKDDSLLESDKLPPPAVIAQEIVDDLEAALEQFRLIAGDLGSDTGAAAET